MSSIEAPLTFGAPYAESKYYAAFKRVRNTIQKFSAASIVHEAVRRLHAVKAGDIEAYVTHQPWAVLLLIKWTLCHGNFSGDREWIGSPQFNKLLNLMHDVDGAGRLPTQFGSAFLFFRSMAYQQFWLQEDIHYLRFARQSLLFSSLDSSHLLSRRFSEVVGVPLADATDLGMLTLAGFATRDQSSIAPGYFSSVADSFSPRAIDRFLARISATPGALRAHLLSEEGGRPRVSHEYHEQTPLRRFPLLVLGGNLVSYWNPLLCRTLETFVYDQLRGHDASGFMDSFGDVFESYVRKSLEWSSLPFLDETDLLPIVREAGGSQVVDFLVESEGANILLDAKGVEIGHLGMTSPRPNIVADRAKDSVVRGIVQGMRAAEAFARAPQFSGRNWRRENNFLLLVTFKQLYLGTGKDFYEGAAREKLDRYFGGDPTQGCIPLEHIYIVSIDDFDVLAEVVRGGRITIGELLRWAVRDDANSRTKKFTLIQHISAHGGEVQVPEFLRREAHRIFDRCLIRIRKS